jgi:hypothetical protein
MQPMNDYLFNFSFTRADEDHAHVYRVGMHVEAKDIETATEKLRVRNSHLSIIEVLLFAVFDEDGNSMEVSR